MIMIDDNSDGNWLIGEWCCLRLMMMIMIDDDDGQHDDHDSDHEDGWRWRLMMTDWVINDDDWL